MRKRKIAIFTGTRAEYGLLHWIIKGLNDANDVDVMLMVGGMHLSPEFGNTINEIKRDGFKISHSFEFLLSSETAEGISKSMGLALISASEFFERNRPDILLVLGDRYESFAVSQAAMIARIPIAHIHGGEITEGLIDEAIRHSITKMSHFHYTATEEYRKRIIQLGENPKNIFNYGAPGIDNIKKLKLLNKKDLSQKFNISFDAPYFMATYHPVTLTENDGEKELANLITALDAYKDYQVIISYPNADTNSRVLIDILERYRDKNLERVHLFQSLGQLNYLSLLKHSKLVIGNSSSGIIEAPSLKTPTVNIGDRQSGRIKGETVISCKSNVDSIKKAIKKGLSKSFDEKCKRSKNPYGTGEASKKIIKSLRSIKLENILIKKFHNLK
tara:strand:+ start:161 stop:1324 length:1164 start_codon:yes stop_codon:yes gene_type:complete